MKPREPAPLLSTAAMQAAAALMVALSLLLLLGGAAVWIVQRPVFDLRRIELRAADGRHLQHVTVASVRAATLGRLSGNFFTMRLDDARRVFESVPWVASVSLRRTLPDRLVVTVTEHRVLAVWDNGRLLSDSGVLFVANVAEAELDGALPRVEAQPRFSRDVARRLPQLTAQTAALGFQIEAVDVSDRASWSLRTVAGPTIELGRDEPPGRLDERLALLVSQYPTASAHVGNEILRIDTRYPQGFAVAAAASRKP